MKSWVFQVFLMEFRKLITYRADFWVNFIGQTFFPLVVAYFLWDSIFHFAGKEEINGFNIQTMIFYYLMAPLIFRIQQGHGIGFASREIYDGSLNKYLLYPIDFYRYKMATYIANSSFFLIQLFVILGIYQGMFWEHGIFNGSPLYFTVFLVSVLLSSICFFYLFTLAEFMAFWFDNIWSLGVILRFLTSFLGGALIPLSFFPESIKTYLMYTPFPYFIDFPMQLLMGAPSVDLILKNFAITIGWLVFFKLLSLFIWNRGKYQYTGVGI